MYLTERSELLNDLLDYLNTGIVNYISYDLKQQDKVEQIDQIKFLMTRKARELQKRKTFSILDIRKQTCNKKSVKQYVFHIY